MDELKNAEKAIPFMEELKFIRSNKGKQILLLEGFIYNKDKEIIPNKCRWRCRTRGCSGSLILLNNSIIHKFTNHNHIKDEAKCTKMVYMDEIKQKARDTNDRSVGIVVSSFTVLRNNEQLALPSIKYAKDEINRIRNKIKGFSNDIYKEIPELLTKTISEEKFFRYDSGFSDSERVIIFHSDNSMKFLKHAKHFLVDELLNLRQIIFTNFLLFMHLFLGKHTL